MPIFSCSLHSSFHFHFIFIFIVCRYTESTILILDFRLMVKSLSLLTSPHTNGRAAFCTVEKERKADDHISKNTSIKNYVICDEQDSHHNFIEKHSDHDGYTCNIKNHNINNIKNDIKNHNINDRYECKIPNNFYKSSTIPECSSTISVLKDLSSWLAVHHKLRFQETLSQTENFINHDKIFDNENNSVKSIKIENGNKKNHIIAGNGKENINQNENKIENTNTTEISENIVPKNFQILSNIFSLKSGNTSFTSVDPAASGNTVQGLSNSLGTTSLILSNDKMNSCVLLNTDLVPDLGLNDSDINNSSSSSSSSDKGGIVVENKLLNFGRVLNSSCLPAANVVMSGSSSSPRFVKDESNTVKNILLQQQRLEHIQCIYVCPPRSEWGKITLHHS